jgi:hypothetical protein
MNRADAIKLIEERAGERLERMFDMLADAYEGLSDQKESAKANFNRGLPMLKEAKIAAIDMITKAFPE